MQLERRRGTTAPYGGGENTGNESSIDGALCSSSDVGGEPNDILCGSRQPSKDTVMMAEVGVGACKREPALGVVGGSSSTGVWKPCGETGEDISGEESCAKGAVAALKPVSHQLTIYLNII